MIQLLSRKQINIEKYDTCIANATQCNVFGFSWYLDIACTNWSALVLDDYDAVMPIPWRKKLFTKYVYPPFWILELGIYSNEVVDENEFLIALFDSFNFVETRLNTHNSFSMFLPYRKVRSFQYISLNKTYDLIVNNYRKDRKKDLKKALKHDLTEKWNGDARKFIQLYQKNIGKRVKKLREKDYQNLYELIKVSQQKKVGDLLSIYNKGGVLVAAGFFLKYQGKVSIVASATDLKMRKNGANTFLIDRAIYKYEPHYKEFNFGGSSMKNIAKYFLSFGAKNQQYYFLKYNNLSKILRFFKR